MELILVQFGLAFALIYALFTLIQLFRRSERVLFFDVLLVFSAALIPLAGVVMAHMDGIPSSEVTRWAVAGGVGLLVFGAIIALVEWRRQQGLEQSRGVLALGAGILLAGFAFVTPVIAAYITLPPAPPVPEAMVQADPTAERDETAPPAEDDPAGNFSDILQSERFETVFVRLFDIVGEETGMDVNGVLSALDSGETVESLINRNDGNLQRVIDDLTALAIEQLRLSAGLGEITPLQAVGGIMFAEQGIRMVVSNDLRTLQNMGREREDIPDELDALGENGSFFDFLTTTPDATADRGDARGQTVMATPTATPTSTIAQGVTPSRTPMPTPTPTNTRVLYASPTPTLTPTLPAPCVALTLYNVNLRATPDGDSDLLVTIPFETAINLFGRNSNSTWWFAEYEGQAGWLNGEFIRITSACDALPVR